MTKKNISYNLLILLIVCIAIQFSSFGVSGNLYFILRNFIIVLVIAISLLNFHQSTPTYLTSSTFKIHARVLIISAIILLIISAFSTIKVRIAPIRDLALSLIIIMIGINLTLSKKQFNRLVTLFIILFTLSAVSIVFKYSSGFNIPDLYLPIPKNQFAPAYGTAFVLSLYLAFQKNTKMKVLYFILSVLLMASLLVIRGRALLVAVFFSIFIFLFFYVKDKKYRILAIITILVLLPYIGNIIFESFFLNYDLTDINSISTGRHERNLEGILFLSQYPLFGELEHFFRGLTIHNYILYITVSYGILLGGIILIPYFKYIIVTINAVKRNTYQYYEVGPLLMIILLIISLFEYTYPYAPGSAIFFPFFLMGQYLQMHNKNYAN